MCYEGSYRFVGLTNSCVETKTLHYLRRFRLEMGGHLGTDVCETDVHRLTRREHIFDAAIRCVPTGAKKSRSLPASTGNFICYEVELGLFNVRGPVSISEVEGPKTAVGSRYSKSTVKLLKELINTPE